MKIWNFVFVNFTIEKGRKRKNLEKNDDNGNIYWNYY